jgi:molecular chaperone DnaJ
MKDYYSILQVSQNASQDEIKNSYRKLSKLYHPDTTKNDPEKEKEFKEITEAYKILYDENSRRSYDSLKSNVNKNYNSFDFSSFFKNIDPSIFRNNFNRTNNSSYSPKRGDNIYVKEKFKLEDIYGGITDRELTYNFKRPCGTCEGRKIKNGKKPDMCSSCKGLGKIEKQSNYKGQIFFNSMEECSKCNGEGFVVKDEDKCDFCYGSGVVLEEAKIKYSIPKGIKNNNSMSFRFRGDKGFFGGHNGDLVIGIELEEHEIFKIDDHTNNVMILYPITLYQAVLGCDIEVPALNGELLKFKVEGGKNYLNPLVKKNYGWPIFREENRCGDFVVVPYIVFKDSLIEEEKEFFKNQVDYIDRSKFTKYIKKEN